MEVKLIPNMNGRSREAFASHLKTESITDAGLSLDEAWMSAIRFNFLPHVRDMNPQILCLIFGFLAPN